MQRIIAINVIRSPNLFESTVHISGKNNIYIEVGRSVAKCQVIIIFLMFIIFRRKDYSFKPTLVPI